jgi:hypothetical protein
VGRQARLSISKSPTSDQRPSGYVEGSTGAIAQARGKLKEPEKTRLNNYGLRRGPRIYPAYLAGGHEDAQLHFEPLDQIERLICGIGEMAGIIAAHDNLEIRAHRGSPGSNHHIPRRVAA